jgi:hypothetical protein
MPNSRKYNWQHYSYIGTARLVQCHLKRLQSAPSITPQDKAHISAIQTQLSILEQNIRHYRVDEDGKIRDIGDRR